jgi:hypothetical protein
MRSLKLRGRKVCGGKLRLHTLDDLDGRTMAAKRARDLVDGLVEDAGGADEVTVGQQQLIQRAACLGAYAEDIETRWLAGAEIDAREFAAIVNTQRRVLVAVGLQRRARDVTPDLRSYVREKYGAVAPP